MHRCDANSTAYADYIAKVLYVCGFAEWAYKIVYGITNLKGCQLCSAFSYNLKN